jgi:hypothetical protein
MPDLSMLDGGVVNELLAGYGSIPNQTAFYIRQLPGISLKFPNFRVK